MQIWRYDVLVVACNILHLSWRVLFCNLSFFRFFFLPINQHSQRSCWHPLTPTKEIYPHRIIYISLTRSLLVYLVVCLKSAYIALKYRLDLMIIHVSSIQFYRFSPLSLYQCHLVPQSIIINPENYTNLHPSHSHRLR